MRDEGERTDSELLSPRPPPAFLGTKPSRARREGTTLRCAGDGEWKAVFTQETEIFKL